MSWDKIKNKANKKATIQQRDERLLGICLDVLYYICVVTERFVRLTDDPVRGSTDPCYN